MSRSNKAAAPRLRENAACVFESLHERIYNYTNTRKQTQTHIIFIYLSTISSQLPKSQVTQFSQIVRSICLA